MKKVRELSKFIPNPKKPNLNQPGFFVFCEKSTAATQFRAEANADLNCTVERMAGLLAMQCLVRGSNPDDFDILIAAEQTFTNRLLSRAKELLDEGRAVASPCSLSPRQQEILHSVICNRANKEIASKLNITVRTVKFHISSLLNRFGVQNRTELARRAAGLLRPAALEGGPLDWDEPQGNSGRKTLGLVAMNTSRDAEFSKRVLTA